MDHREPYSSYKKRKRRNVYEWQVFCLVFLYLFWILSPISSFHWSLHLFLVTSMMLSSPSPRGPLLTLELVIRSQLGGISHSGKWEAYRKEPKLPDKSREGVENRGCLAHCALRGCLKRSLPKHFKCFYRRAKLLGHPVEWGPCLLLPHQSPLGNKENILAGCSRKASIVLRSREKECCSLSNKELC